MTNRLATFLFLLLTTVGHAEVNDVLAIANSTYTGSNITKAEIRSLYLMKTRHLFNGESVVLFQLPRTHASHIQFVRSVLGMSPEQYSSEWNRIVNSGAATSVRYVTTKAEMLYRISITPNSIGYMDSAHMVLYSGDSDVKILNIVD